MMILGLLTLLPPTLGDAALSRAAAARDGPGRARESTAPGPFRLRDPSRTWTRFPGRPGPGRSGRPARAIPSTPRVTVGNDTGRPEPGPSPQHGHTGVGPGRSQPRLGLSPSQHWQAGRSRTEPGPALGPTTGPGSAGRAGRPRQHDPARPSARSRGPRAAPSGRPWAGRPAGAGPAGPAPEFVPAPGGPGVRKLPGPGPARPGAGRTPFDHATIGTRRRAGPLPTTARRAQRG